MLKCERRMTASILKQDPKGKRFQRMLFIRTKPNVGILGGIPLSSCITTLKQLFNLLGLSIQKAVKRVCVIMCCDSAQCIMHM